MQCGVGVGGVGYQALVQVVIVFTQRAGGGVRGPSSCSIVCRMNTNRNLCAYTLTGNLPAIPTEEIFAAALGFLSYKVNPKL